MPRHPPRRAPPAPTTPSFAEPPPIIAPPPAVTTPIFATPRGFQRDEALPNAIPAWQIPPPQQQQQQRFNQPVPTMSEPLEDSDIENDPVDDRVRAIDFDALDDNDDNDDGEEDDEDLEDELDDEEVEGEDDENEEIRARRMPPSLLHTFSLT